MLHPAAEECLVMSPVCSELQKCGPASSKTPRISPEASAYGDGSAVQFELDCDVHHISEIRRVRPSGNDQSMMARSPARSGSRARGATVIENSFVADRQLIEALEKRSQPVSCSEGRTLFKQGEAPRGVYIFKSGEAFLVMKIASGRTMKCLHAGAGSLLGLPAVIGNEPFTLTAIVRKGSEVEFVTRSDFEDAIRTEPSLYPRLLQLLATEVRSARLAILGV